MTIGLNNLLIKVYKINQGYKVAKVDQMENSISKGIREKQTPITKDKCIQRALVSVLTKGTLIDSGLLKNDDANHTISIMEDAGRFCVWIVDASTSLFRVAVFEDDDGIIVETLVRQIKPIEVLGVRGSRFIEKVFKAINGTVEWRNANMVLGLEDVVDEIRFKKYFDGGLSFDSWPNVLQEYKDDKLVLQCFGVLLTYLQSLLIDSIIASGTFKKYDPIQSTDSLVLNGQTLSNLEIFESEVSGDGTLFKLINRCKTAMGKRMFKQWVCHPLFDVDRINERLDAVDFLFKETGLKSEIEAALKKLPDLERVVSRIRFGRCKVKDFVDALDAFREISDIFGNQEYIGLLGRLLSEPVSENITLALNFFQECFSDDQVDGENIQTNTGFDQVFDEADMKLKEIEQEIESERKSASREIGVQIVFKDMGKELFQMQVPVKTSVPQVFPNNIELDSNV